MQTATVSLGRPVTETCLIPVRHNSTPKCIEVPFMADGTCYNITALSFGTPHGAVFVGDVEETDVPSLGRALGTHRLFPNGASIVFIQMTDGNSLKARLWQRGRGEIPFTLEAAGVAGTAAMMSQKTCERGLNVSMGGKMFRVSWDGCGEVFISDFSGGL